MSATVAIVFRVAVFIGIAVYMWSVSTSLEQIAKDLRRLADRTSGKETADVLDPR